jgi:hypothetical protein
MASSSSMAPRRLRGIAPSPATARSSGSEEGFVPCRVRALTEEATAAAVVANEFELERLAEDALASKGEIEARNPPT